MKLRLAHLLAFGALLISCHRSTGMKLSDGSPDQGGTVLPDAARIDDASASADRPAADGPPGPEAVPEDRPQPPPDQGPARPDLGADGPAADRAPTDAAGDGRLADGPAADRAPADVGSDVRLADGPAADRTQPDAATDAQPGTLEALCLATGGTVGTALCCASTDDFPDTCLTGPCGCAPTSSKNVAKCSCLGGRCFSRLAGCGPCAYGADQTCNDDPIISSIHGRCQPDGTCLCTSPWTLNPASGRCN